MNDVRPELKRLHSPDMFDLNFPTLNPSEPFCVVLPAMFGPEGLEGEESFDVLVCNAKWVEQKSKEGAFFGHHHLIISRFDISEIRKCLINNTANYSGATWAEVASKLAKIGRWEFEDYTVR